MFLFKTERALQNHLSALESKKIGFVPTLGALHIGHQSLISASLEKNQYTVVSIFVNPTQFNDASDLEKYPRTIDTDLELLYKSGCDAVFYPDEREVYQSGKAEVPQIELGHLNNTLEAAFRKGHFEGVMQVVARLLEMVKPDTLYMGQKDLQQLTIIRKMIHQLQIPVELVACPIIRTSSGLAVSSRNARLAIDILPHVHNLYEALTHIKTHVNDQPLAILKQEALEKLSNPLFRVEYLEFLDAKDLSIIQDSSMADDIVAALAVWANDVRLIDNMLIKGIL